MPFLSTNQVATTDAATPKGDPVKEYNYNDEKAQDPLPYYKKLLGYKPKAPFRSSPFKSTSSTDNNNIVHPLMKHMMMEMDASAATLTSHSSGTNKSVIAGNKSVVSKTTTTTTKSMASFRTTKSSKSNQTYKTCMTTQKSSECNKSNRSLKSAKEGEETTTNSTKKTTETRIPSVMLGVP